MMKERNKAVPAVYLVLKKEDQILLMRRSNTGYHDGDYALCAGHIEAGELPVESLVREVAEELGIKIEPRDVRLVYTLYRTKHDETGDRVDLFFEAAKWSGEIANQEPHKCDDVQWFPIDKLPPNMPDHIRKVIMDIENGVDYGSIKFDKKYIS